MITKKIIKFGKEIDAAFDVGNKDGLHSIINEAEAYNSINLTNDEIAVLDYFLGNAWSCLDKVNNRNETNIWVYERKEKINAIKYYRKCVSNTSVSTETKSNIFIQALTNLGNLFSESGRIVYAIESWKRALEICPGFGMAGANLCHGLIYYASILYDQNHAALILKHSHTKLETYIRCEDIYKEAKVAFEADLKWLKSSLKKEFLNKPIEFKNYSLGRSKKELNYKKWILANALYLNPLNDIYSQSAIAHDVLHLPSMITTEFAAPIYHGFYNEIKQEYITARYLFYAYENEFPEGKLHYSDIGRNLVNTLDYPQYGLRYELIKDAFRSLYSIFDKVAYFINEYFGIGKDKDKVYFRSIWYQKDKVNPIFDQLSNNPLRGLYFLSKDFYSKDMDYLEVADKDAQNLAEIRNNLEHKYFQMYWLKTNENDKSRYDYLAYSISEAQFKEKTYRLLKCAREAIIYLSLAIHVAEMKNKPRNGLLMPIPMIGYD